MTSVSEPCPPAGGATIGRSGHRGLTRQSVARKDADGPAARPTTPLAVENSVGEPAARWRPTSAHGKESVASSHPRFGPGGSKESPGPLLFGRNIQWKSIRSGDFQAIVSGQQADRRWVPISPIRGSVAQLPQATNVTATSSQPSFLNDRPAQARLLRGKTASQ